MSATPDETNAREYVATAMRGRLDTLLALEEVTHHADLSAVIAFSGNRELYFATDGVYSVRRGRERVAC